MHRRSVIVRPAGARTRVRRTRRAGLTTPGAGLSATVLVILVCVLAAGCAGPAAPDPPDPTVHAVARAVPAVASGSPVRAAPVRAHSPTTPVRTHSSAAPACGQATARAGWLRRENARRGSRSFRLPRYTRTVLSGYLDASSVRCGQTVGIHLSGVGVARVQAFRIGWYGGAGARLVWSSAWVPTFPQPIPGPTATANLVEPRWPATLRVRVDGAWVPGLYLLVPTDGHGLQGTPMPLVVRDVSGHEPLLVAASDLTWAAYDSWGGWNLYHGPVNRRMSQAARFASRARVVSLRRPLTGDGLVQLASYDLPLVRFVERLGIDTAYTTDTSIDAQPGQLLAHRALVLGGHDEYWTTRMYDAIDAARAAGVNLAFLGANTAYWHARLESGPDGPATHLAVWRVLSQDPLAASDPAAATVKWDDPPLSRPRVSILGQGYAGIQAHGGLQVLDAPAWMVAGTRLRTGSVLAGAVGNEADGWAPSRQAPPDDQTVLAGVLTGSRGPVIVSTNYYTVPSGAAVFTAGTTAWSCELGPWCPYVSAPATTLTSVQVITANVLRAFSLPRAGAHRPAHRSVLPSPEQLLTRVARAAVGVYGSGEGEAVTPVPSSQPAPVPSSQPTPVPSSQPTPAPASQGGGQTTRG